MESLVKFNCLSAGCHKTNGQLYNARGNVFIITNLRRTRSCSTSDSAYSYTFLCSVVCRLSHSCALLKPFNGFRCHLLR